MKIKLLIIIMMCMFSLSCARKEEVVAYVGRRRITVSDFKRRIEDLPAFYHGFISTDGGRRQYLEGMIKEEILLLKAMNERINKRPEVAERLRDVEKEVLLTAVVSYLFNEIIKVSDDEKRDYYEKNKERFENPMQVKVSHILVSSYKEAEEIVKKLNQRVSFEKLARERSIDTLTAISGGDVGHIERGEMPIEFENEVFNIERVGEISNIIKTAFGYHIVKLTGRRRGISQSFEEAKESINQELINRKFNLLLENYRKKYNVQVNHDVLDNIRLKK